MITRKTIAHAIKEAREYERDTEARHAVYYARYGNSMDAPRTIVQVNAKATERAYNEVMPAYGWPGGYDMAYYPTDEYGSLVGDVLCSDCARAFIKSNKAVAPDTGYGLHAESCDGYEGDDSDDHLLCDDCGKVICEAWQREEEEIAD